MKRLVFAGEYDPAAILDWLVAGGVNPLDVRVEATADELRVFISEAVNEKVVQQVVAAYDPNQLTPQQQAAAQRQALLEQMRQDYAVTPLNLNDYQDQPALILQLAQKVAWLEQEIKGLGL